MGIEPSIGDNPSVTDTLRGTAGQAAETLQGGGDLEDLTKYFHRYRLLWLKQYAESMLWHLKRYIKEFPTLHWLPHKTIQHTVLTMYKQPLQRATLPASVLRELQDLPNNNIEDERDPNLLNIPLNLRDLLRVFLGR